MAKVIKKHRINTVKNNYYKTFMYIILSGIAIGVCLVFSVKTYGISLLPAVPFVFIIKKLLPRINQLKQGFVGEQQTLRLLSRLPGNYRILPDLTLLVFGKTGQTDNIIIGERGIFIVETKNHVGRIDGDADMPKLKQTKTTPGQGHYTTLFYNPVRQVQTHVKLLEELLRKNGLRITPQGIVYFSNPQADVRVKSKIIPVFSAGHGGKRKLKRYIKRYPCHLTDQQIQKAEKIIRDNSK